MTVSVCITCFNLERYVGAAIDSAIAQEGAEVEVIVVDDGSSDGSWDIITSYGDAVVAIRQSNLGQISAASTALAGATGDVVCFLDGDDMLEPGILSRVSAAFHAEPSLVLLQWRMRIIDASGRGSGELWPRKLQRGAEGLVGARVLRRGTWPWQLTSATAYAAAVLRELLPPSRDPSDFLDYHLNGLVPLYGRVRTIDAVGTSYRRHGANASAELTGSRYARDQIERALRLHPFVVEVSARLGLDPPAEPLARLDAALLGFRLWSLRVDPDAHPVPGDRRGRLVVRGVAASASNSFYAIRHRVARSAWFVLLGVLPDRGVKWLLSWYAPDGPIMGR